MIHFLGLSEDSSSSVLDLVWLSSDQRQIEIDRLGCVGLGRLLSEASAQEAGATAVVQITLYVVEGPDVIVLNQPIAHQRES